ncbi:MAG: hypothetical protein HYY03_06205 [Chloroflexi bacterium]|nr:hypothetical protein [Chloroflexota bacterium]
MGAFDASVFLPPRVLARLTDIRVDDPERVVRAAEKRERRARLAPDGRLNIVAADHPARRVTRVGDDPLAMADRHDYLARVVRVLMSDKVDGVMASMDLLEELLALHDLLREAGGPPLLEGRLLVASLNRGGLAGSSWELDDPLTGPTPAVCRARGLDGVKLLLRICDDESSSLKTMTAVAQAMRETNAVGLPVFLEALPVVRGEAGYEVVRSAGALAGIAGVAAALGDSSRNLWLKLPYCDDFRAVAGATTLPVLLLGGEATGNPASLLREVACGLAAGANVRGAMIGRNVLYPGNEDPLAVAEAVGGLVHQGWTLEQAEAALSEARGRDLDAITGVLG